MPADPAHCAAACAWGGLCAPGRCILAECADSPNYARFAPRPQSSVSRVSVTAARGGRCNRVPPSGLEDRGISRARLDPVAVLAGIACAGGMALVLAHWWGIV